MQQTWFFLSSILLGALLGVIYDLFRILRIAFSHSVIAVLLEDILFWVIGALITIGFFLVMDDGQLRIFVLVGEIIGFILYYFSIGILVIRAAKWIIGAIRWVAYTFFQVLIAPIVLVFSKIWNLILEIYKKILFYLGKQAKISNTHLKSIYHLLYNKKTQRSQNQRREGSNANEGRKRTKT